MCGSYGDLSTFSFYANKHITTGEGGMICTDNKLYYEKCKYLRNLCFNDIEDSNIIILDTMQDYQPSICSWTSTTRKINQSIKKKIFIGNFYNDNIKAKKVLSNH